MHLTVLIEMVAEGMPDRVVVSSRDTHLTAEQLRRYARAAAEIVERGQGRPLLYLAGNGPAFPIALVAAAYAGVPFLPLNYRLADAQLAGILDLQPNSLVVTDDPQRVAAIASNPTMDLPDFVEYAATAPGQVEPDAADADPDAVAVLLMTSGTTAAPKSAVLRHKHLTSYVVGSVEFMAADPADAALISVPPYHVAAVANLLSNLYIGRRISYLDQFTAAGWLDRVNEEAITHAMVVPTMLARIVEELEKRREQGPETLRTLSYGGSIIARPVLIRALELFPHTGFVNAYGLTETASSIAVLGPDDHRNALNSDDVEVQARLFSAGRPLPTVEIEIHDDAGASLPANAVGEIVVRGPQVAGEYIEVDGQLSESAWFHTRDLGYLDDAGFLFVKGRADDTIIRGGENIAPSEIEAALNDHASVAEIAVAGVPDNEWGHRIAAFVVPKPGHVIDREEFRTFARARLRGSKTPDQIVIVDQIPTTPTGKVLRRELVNSLVQLE